MSSKKQLLAQYDLHNVLFNNVLANISEQESNQCLTSNLKSVKWLAGHLLWANANLANIGGVEVKVLWRGHFHSVEGATPEDLNASKSELPTLQEILNKWNEDAVIIRKGLENLPEEALNSTIDIPHPMMNFDKTLAGLWAFINHHQAYTIGQVAILRRGLGKDAMRYF